MSAIIYPRPDPPRLPEPGHLPIGTIARDRRGDQWWFVTWGDYGPIWRKVRWYHREKRQRIREWEAATEAAKAETPQKKRTDSVD